MRLFGIAHGLHTVPRLVIIAAMIVAGMAVGIGIATVAATHDANTIHACVDTKSGDARIVLDGEGCRKGETAVQWNIVGPQGSVGPQGPAGADGQDGANGISGLEKHFEEFTIPAGGIRTRFASCTEGRVAISGGYQVDSGLVTVSDSFPGGVTTQWGVTVRNTDTADHTLRVYVVCGFAS